MKLLRTVIEALRRIREAAATRDAVLLVARLVLAWVFIYHGAATLFGAFHGPGLHGQAAYFGTQAHLHPAMFFAVLNGLIEFGGGIGIGLGIFSRLFALGLVGDMTMAIITVTGGQGIASSAAGSGYELNLALGGLALLVALCGSGQISFEPLLTRWGQRIVPPAPVP